MTDLDDARREVDEAFWRWADEQWAALIRQLVDEIRRGYVFTSSASYSETEEKWA